MNRTWTACQATIPESELLQSENEVFDMRKKWVDALDDVLKDPRSAVDLRKILDGKISKAISEHNDAMYKRFGEDGGGDGVREFAGISCLPGPLPKCYKGSTN